MNGEYRASVLQLGPVLACLLFGLLCAELITTTPSYSVTPFPEGTGSVGNALYFVIAVLIGASLIYLLIKRRRLRVITLLVGFALTTAMFLLSFVYLYVALSFLLLDADLTLFLVAILSVVLVVLGDIAIFRDHNQARNMTLLLLGGGLGTFLGWSVPFLSALLILSFLAVYDIYAVYRGAVGKIARSGLDQLHGLTFSFRDIQMGLGDLTFYAMLSGKMLLEFGLVSSLTSIVGILLGCWISFKLLEKKGMFPGLPFPILLGLTSGYFITFALLG